jgi:FkbM family methyltransferase
MARTIATIGKPILRSAYKRALRLENQEEKARSLQKLLSWRQLLHPPGGRQLAMARLGDGLAIWVNLCEMVGGDLYYGIGFEPIEVKIVRELVRPGDVFFDVGANIGFYSVIASRLVGCAGAVHAFEPIRSIYDQLLRNLSLNCADNVRANHIAVAERCDELDLFVNRESALTSLGRTARGQVVSVERVSSISLDEYADQHEVASLNFLKIDVEGFEGHVLRGGNRLIERSNELTVLCELAEKNFKPLNLSVDDVIAWVREHGYEVWEIDRVSNSVVKLEMRRLSETNQNFVFVRPGSTSQSFLMKMMGRSLA